MVLVGISYQNRVRVECEFAEHRNPTGTQFILKSISTYPLFLQTFLFAYIGVMFMQQLFTLNVKLLDGIYTEQIVIDTVCTKCK